MKRFQFALMNAALTCADVLTRLHIMIPDAPPLSDMAESAPTVPEATYDLRVHKADYVAQPKSKDAKGPYIKAQFVITGPAGAAKSLGRMIFQNYSMSADGNWRLRELLVATGHDDTFQLQDSDQLVGLELSASVIIKPGTQGYSDKNEIKKHYVLGQAPEMVQTGTPATT